MAPEVRLARTVAELTPGAGYRALLLDWDGTLADTQHRNYDLLVGALGEVGLSLDYDWFAARTGVSTPEMIAEVARLAGRADVDVEAVAADRDARFAATWKDVTLVPHLAAFLRRQHGEHLLALATGGGEANVLPVVERFGLDEVFDAIVTRADVERGKPAPDIFLEAAARIDVPPEDCLVYEDSDEGLAGAAAAGMDAVDVRPLRMRELGY